MSVTSAHRDQNSGSFSEDNQGNVVFVEDWTVICSTITDAQPTVMAYASLPDIGDSFSVGTSTDTTRKVTARSGRRDDKKPEVWRVKITYSTQNTTGSFSGEAGALLAMIPEIRGYGIPFTKIAVKDRNGKAIVNSANQPFDPPAEMDDQRSGVQYSRYVSACPQAVAQEYRNAINTDTIWAGKAWAVPPQCGKVASYDWDREIVEGVVLYKETVQIDINVDKWLLILLNAGLYEKVTGKLKRCVDGNGVPVDEPVRLDSTGGQMAITSESYFLDFEIYKEKAFAPLNIPALDSI